MLLISFPVIFFSSITSTLLLTISKRHSSVGIHAIIFLTFIPSISSISFLQSLTTATVFDTSNIAPFFTPSDFFSAQAMTLKDLSSFFATIIFTVSVPISILAYKLFIGHAPLIIK